MRYRTLGDTGMKVSVVGLGTNQFGGKVSQKQVDELLSAALDAGLNFIDTANIYQGGASEEAIGNALAGRRGQVIIATKAGMKMGEGPNETGASRKHIFDAVEDSLRRLQTDYIDLYQIHQWDPDTPVGETMRALEDLVRQGKVRYIGVSNFSAWQLCLGQGICRDNGCSPIASVQPHYNLLHRQAEEQLLPCCEHLGVGVLPYFPLAGGFLTGKYRRGEDPPEGSRGQRSDYVQQFFTDQYFDAVENLQKYAEERGYNLAQLAIAWLAAQPQVSSVIAGVTSLGHLQSNIRAAEWEMTPGEDEKTREMVAKLPARLPPRR